MATPNPTQNTEQVPPSQPQKASVPTVACPTCISGIHPSGLEQDYLEILKR